MGDSLYRHFILNKPYGYLSQFVLKGNSKKKLLGEFFEFPKGTMAIGRLDKHSEGLLLLTTNGKVSAKINSSKVEKEYYVQVDGLISKDKLSALETGIEIKLEHGHYMTKGCKVNYLDREPEVPPRAKKIRGDHHGPTTWISIILTEGKFRQIRKMTAKVGHPTLRLYRVRIGNIKLENLLPGEVIEVIRFDIDFQKK